MDGSTQVRMQRAGMTALGIAISFKNIIDILLDEITLCSEDANGKG